MYEVLGMFEVLGKSELSLDLNLILVQDGRLYNIAYSLNK